MTFDPKEYLRVRGRRVTATVMTTLEEHAWEHIPEDQQRHIRSVVLSTIAEYQDLAMDLVSSEQGSINEFWVEELSKIHKELRALNGSTMGIRR
jgi:hypothetical protein